MSERQTKAWRQYTESKGVVEAKPELSHLGNHRIGLPLEQLLRSYQALLVEYDININLSNVMIFPFVQQYISESELNDYADGKIDIITLLGIWGVDTKPRKMMQAKRGVAEVEGGLIE